MNVQQVEEAEALADEMEQKLSRLLAAVKTDRAHRPPLPADAVVDEYYVQRMEQQAEVAEQELKKLKQSMTRP